jgi:ribosomal protein S18 acetylase RimI-like enzyme
MKLIEEYSDIQFHMNFIRSLRKGFITNFYPEEFKTNLWITKKELFFEIVADTIFFFHNSAEFTTLFYCSINFESLSNSLKMIKFEERLITDIVTKDLTSPVLNVFYQNGFKEHSSLVRMSKINQLNDSFYLLNKKIRNATLIDIKEVLSLLANNFDKYTEQIPVYEELEQWVKQSHLIVYELDSKIAGFLIYDLTGVTLYLRYWFVCPEHRDQKIGSELIREYLYRGKETKRQIFWVIESNDNAIKRYEHYGFTKEKMYDYILIK